MCSLVGAILTLLCGGVQQRATWPWLVVPAYDDEIPPWVCAVSFHHHALRIQIWELKWKRLMKLWRKRGWILSSLLLEAPLAELHSLRVPLDMFVQNKNQFDSNMLRGRMQQLHCWYVFYFFNVYSKLYSNCAVIVILWQLWSGGRRRLKVHEWSGKSTSWW